MYMELLSPSERKNALSINGENLQKSCCAVPCTGAHHPLEILDTDCKIDPRLFEFKKNKFGKPEILWRSDDDRTEWPLHFNILHTSSLIACGVTMDAPIGIDIEEKKRKTAKNVLSLADRYFTPSEFNYLVNLPDPDAQQKEFIKLWTLKEAYVKALEEGFQEAKALKDSNSSCDCLSENWKFALAELYGSYYMAVCIEDDSRSSGSEDGRSPLGLKVWKTVPFSEDILVSGTEAVKFIS